MKINWGTSIIIAFALFMTFILYFVFEVQSNSKYDNELVVEEYYKHDARYSEEMDKLANAGNLSEKPVIESTPEGVKITFPESVDTEKISGNVSFYRPSAKKLDFNLLLKLSGRSMLVPVNDLAGGLWDTTLSWTYNGREYVIKKEIYLH